MEPKDIENQIAEADFRHQLKSLIETKKDCTTCIHENNNLCKKYCINFLNHEFKCEYCKYKLLETDKKFCEMENDDGSQNCCGDHFEFNHAKFKV